MLRSKLFTVVLVLLMIPIGLYAGWDWPAGPGTSKSKVADVDNQNTGLGTPGAKIVYNPDKKRVQLVYIPNLVEYPNSRLMYAYSTDDGETFTSLGPIDNGKYARNTAIATDAKDVPYIVWCEFDGPPTAADPQQTVAIYFAKDVDFAAGLFESKLVSDPAQVDLARVGYPSISVSPDGKHIVIAWSTVKPSATQLQPTGIRIVTSHDGGETFSAPATVVAPMDLPSNKPILSEVANPTTVIGDNGYVFCLFTVFSDSSDAYDRRPAFIESKDYGITWSAPTLIPMHPEASHGHTWHSTFGPPILVNGEPHFAWVCKAGSSFPPGSVAVWHFGRKNGTWTQTRVSPPYDEEDLFFENSNFCSIGKDKANNIYVCYLTTSIAAGYYWGFIGLHVSSDNGLTWNKYPLPMHDYMAREDRYFRSSLPSLAQNVGPDKLHVLGLQGGYWSGPVQAVWVFHADPREIAGYKAPAKEDYPSKTDALYTFDNTVPFQWNEIDAIGMPIPRSAWNPDPDDGSFGPVDMGINFNFYGKTFNSCYIAVNGQISFTDEMVLVAPAEGKPTIPGIAYDNLLCVFAGDLNNGAYPDPPYANKSGTVYYYKDTANQKFIVEWKNLNNHVYVENNLCVDTTITFQAVLNAKDQSITYLYKDVGIGGYGKGTIIGIQPSKNDTLGVQYYGGGFPRNGYPSNGTAIKFYPRAGSSVTEHRSKPEEYALHQNYPNPFNPSTEIRFHLQKDGVVRLSVYNLMGQEVKVLIDKKMSAGKHTVIWDGTDHNRQLLPSGIYFYRLESNDFSYTRKMTFIR